MRLINVHTRELEEFPGSDIPKYAILSHTWGNAEITYPIWKTGYEERMEGFNKITTFCDIVRRQGIGYAWADTCCIDKSSSADLSEAVNSMYRYYQDAEVCIVYFADVSNLHKKSNDVVSEYDLLKDSRWFTRGWTLQELIAPRKMEFYDKDWIFIGGLHQLCGTISKITEIGEEILLKKQRFLQCSVAERMSWASRRNTTRLEDEAYCLLGIFEVNMPLLYGEGRKAFMRLQEEIIRRSTDHSIFAWGLRRHEDHRHTFGDLLASTPHDFCPIEGLSRGITQCYQQLDNWVDHYEVTNLGFRISLPLLFCRRTKSSALFHAILNCRQSDIGPLALNVVTSHASNNPGNSRSTPGKEYAVISMPCPHGSTSNRIVTVHEEDILWLKRQQITLTRERVTNPYIERFLNRFRATPEESKRPLSRLVVKFLNLYSRDWATETALQGAVEKYPTDEWSKERHTWTQSSRLGAISIDLPGTRLAIVFRKVSDITVAAKQLLVYAMLDPGELTLDELCAWKELRLHQVWLDADQMRVHGTGQYLIAITFRTTTFDASYSVVDVALQTTGSKRKFMSLGPENGPGVIPEVDAAPVVGSIERQIALRQTELNMRMI